MLADSTKVCQDCKLTVRGARKIVCRVDGLHKKRKGTCTDFEPYSQTYDGKCEKCGAKTSGDYVSLCTSCNSKMWDVVREAEKNSGNGNCAICEELIAGVAYISEGISLCDACYKEYNDTKNVSQKTCNRCFRKYSGAGSTAADGIVCDACADQVEETSKYCRKCKLMRKTKFLHDSIWGSICAVCVEELKETHYDERLALEPVVKHEACCKDCGKKMRRNSSSDTCDTCWGKSVGRTHADPDDGLFSAR